MSLDYLDGKIDEVRARANSARGQLNTYKSEVRNDTRYSPEHKQQLIKEETDRFRTLVGALEAEERKLVHDKIDSLHRSLASTVGSSSADVIAQRDAQERADRLTDENDGLRMLERAIHSDDKSLAYAVLRRGADSGWSRVIDRATEKYPLAGENIQDLDRLHHFLDNPAASLERAMIYGVIA
jgi:hypothetical protein